MSERKELGRGTRFLIITAGLVVVIAGMQAAKSILVLLLLSLFIAVLCIPPMFWMKNKGVPSAVAMIVVMLGVVGVMFGISVLVGSSINDFSRNLPNYQSRILEQRDIVFTWLESQRIDIPDGGVRDVVNPGAIMGLVQSIFAGLGSVLSNTFIILLIVVFILLESVGFEQKMRLAMSNRQAITAFRYIDKVITNVNHYMAIKSAMSFLTGALITIWLAILGVDFPILWGLLAFFLNFVPNIGSFIAAVPAVLLALVQLGGGAALLTGVGFLVVNFVVGNALEPRIMGQGLGLSTLMVFLSLVFWGWVLGPVGMLLSVPLTMIAKIALDSSEKTRWIAILMGSGAEASAKSISEVPPPEPPEPLALAEAETS